MFYIPTNYFFIGFQVSLQFQTISQHFQTISQHKFVISDKSLSTEKCQNLEKEKNINETQAIKLATK